MTIAVGILQYVVFSNQLAVMQGQLDAMESDQRPWVAAEISILSDLIIDEHGANLALKAVLRNIGKSPAGKVQLFAKILGFRPSDTSASDDHGNPSIAFPGVGRPSEYCGSIKPYIAGQVLFPGDNNVSAVGYAKMPLSAVSEELRKVGAGAVNVAVMVCVSYEELKSKKMHYTLKVFHLFKKDCLCAFASTDKVIPVSELRLLAFPFGQAAFDTAN